MDAINTELLGLKILQPKVFGDHRGFFYESYSRSRYEAVGLPRDFVQDNVSLSTRGVLRGLHFQNPGSQGKLVSVLHGEVFDVAVDIRYGSPSFGKWLGIPLNAESKRQFWLPAGFAHGFVVVSETAVLNYKCDAYYNPSHEYSLLWNDPDLGIAWPVKDPMLSHKDNKGRRLRDFSPEELPQYSP